MPRVTATISHATGPSGLWIALKLPAVKRSKYPRQGSQVSRPGNPKPVYIHLHGTPSTLGTQL